MMCLVPFGGKGMEPGVVLTYVTSKMAEPNHKNIFHGRQRWTIKAGGSSGFSARDI